VGDTEIGGLFLGISTPIHGALEVTGRFEFYLNDEFSDPTDFGIDLPGSQDYKITDKWNGSLQGIIVKDPSKSKF